MSDDISAQELEDLDDMGNASSGKKRLVLIAAALFVVCNVGWGAAFFAFGGGEAEAAAPPEVEEAKAEPVDDAKEEVGEGASKRARRAPGPMYKLDPFVVNLDEPRGHHYLRVSIELEVKDEAALAEVEGRLVVVRDRFISVLSSKRLADLKRPRDKDALREELHDLTHEAFDEELVRGVYFTEFLTQ